MDMMVSKKMNHSHSNETLKMVASRDASSVSEVNAGRLFQDLGHITSNGRKISEMTRWGN
jgi:hypothetical protein